MVEMEIQAFKDQLVLLDPQAHLVLAEILLLNMTNQNQWILSQHLPV